MTNPPERPNVPPRPKNRVKESESPRGRRARVQARDPSSSSNQSTKTVQGKAANIEACTAQELERETPSSTGVKQTARATG